MASNFTEVFNNALDELEKEAHSVGLNLTILCRETQISRATPDRWRRHVPKTVAIMTEMQEVINAERVRIAEDDAVRRRHAK
jgi:hypothetical protein